MAFEDMDTEGQEYDVEEQPTPPEEASNRTFIIVAGILGGLTLLALVCIALYAFIILPRQRTQREEQIARLNAQNTQVALAISQTAAAKAFTATPTVTPIPPTATRTPTAVVVVPTNTVAMTVDPRTATVAALLTQAAIVTKTVVPTATALPTTGFADQVGLPGLLALAVLLVVVIFLARRVRMAA